MKVLVTGGAGYIGSHTVVELLEKNYDVVVLDNLETGYADSVLEGKLYIGNIQDEAILNKVFEENKIDAVMHFAAYSLVGESVTNPMKYYENNVLTMMKLLRAMKKYECNKIIFSSTAAIFGEPDVIPILEDAKKEPTNPYGQTKLEIENMLKWYDKAYGIKYVALRYFNAARCTYFG